MHATVSSLIKSVKQQLFPLLTWISKVMSTCSAWTASSPHQFHPNQFKCKQESEAKQPGLLREDTLTPSQGQHHWYWYKMIEVNGAYKYSRYKRTWLKSLCVMSKVKAFCPVNKTNRWWLANQANTTDSTDLYVAHIDQKHQRRK